MGTDPAARQRTYVRRLEGWAQAAAEELQEYLESMREASGDLGDGAHLEALLADYDALNLAGPDDGQP